ncbi:MAG: DUF424 domain-containing protein [Methanoculleaceae archaeon]
MTDMMYLQMHRVPDGSVVLAVCDSELMNTTQQFGDIAIEIKESFYGTEMVDAATVREALETAENVNLIGERSVGIAIEMGLIERSSCIMIGDIPHAQIYRI